METFASFLTQELVNSGLWEHEATAVLEKLKVDEKSPMARRWDEQTSGYPSMMKALTWIEAKHAALEYIDANCPQHWARGMFV